MLRFIKVRRYTLKNLLCFITPSILCFNFFLVYGKIGEIACYFFYFLEISNRHFASLLSLQNISIRNFILKKPVTCT